MPAAEPTFSDKKLFATETRGLRGQLDSYFEACDTLKRLMNLFMRNVASSTLPSEVVELEDVEAADREVCKQAVRYSTWISKYICESLATDYK